MTDIKKILLLVIYFTFILSICTYAQNENITSQKPRKVLKQARNALEHGDIFSTIDYYTIYNQLVPDKPSIQHELGRLLLKEKNYKEAKNYLYKAYKSKPKKYLTDLYYYATCLQTLEEYKEAKSAFELFIKEAKNYNDLKEFSKIARIHTNTIDSIPNLKNNTNNVIIQLLDTSVNKPHIDFSPIPYDNDKLIYASILENEINYYDPETDKLPVRKFYIAKRDGNGWKNLGEFDTTINGSNINTGNGAFSLDKKRFYFTRCENSFLYEKIICKIFVSNYVNNEWQSPVELPSIINTPGTTNSMPTVGISKINTDVLYFISDRNEGRGGLDIWFTYFDRKKNTWKEPKNCGKKINTIFNEITPYYNIETKTLYFSSEGLPTIGGYDIFKAFGEGKNFEDPINVGYPINSSFDDQYYILDESRSKGFFTSNRSGGYSLRHENCCDDIYEFIDRDHINIVVTGKVFGVTDSSFYKLIEDEYKNEMTLDIDVLNRSKSIHLLYDYPIDLYMVDNNTGNEIFIKTDYTYGGNYFFNLEQGFDYLLKVKDYNNEYKQLPFTTKHITKSDTLHLDAILINTIPKGPIRVKNIYYDFAESYLTDSAQKTIDNTIYKFLMYYPHIIIEISSHTDSKGSNELNDTLSQARAQSVVNYLISKGIERDRLVAKGYGKHFPIAPNTHPDGSDNPEGRQKNRRTEFTILGTLDDYDEIFYDE